MEQGFWARLLDYAQPKTWVRMHSVALLVFSNTKLGKTQNW